MAYARRIRQEYKRVCREMEKLMQRGDRAPLPKDRDLYGRLAAIKKTLEWVHPLLIKTKGKGPDRYIELTGYRHFIAGPTFAEMYP